MKQNINWKKAMALTAITASMAAGASADALADQPDGPSTNVWIDVIRRPSQDRICVTVPMAYGFVVVGSQDPRNDSPISIENGNLLLPNLRVEVDEASGPEGNPDYFISASGPQELPVKNYSTAVPEGAEEENEEDAVRTGLAVKLKASMDAGEAGGITAPGGGRSWTLTAGKPGTEEADIRKYRMILEDMPFSYIDPEDPNLYHMAGNSSSVPGEISLDAPPDVETNGWTSAGTANVPSEYQMKVAVEVGGVQGHYRQVEESIKAGTIRWTVEPDLDSGAGAP